METETLGTSQECEFHDLKKRRAKKFLVNLIEEAAEVIQASTKIDRFGAASDYNGVTNLEQLIEELNDIQAVVELLQDEGFLPENLYDATKIGAKKEKIKYFQKV